ncbi:MAG TPA: hypothetical protein VFG03_12255 [Telluria sp.]|nr:hypothetical protein [Telluria sp.]
MELLYLPGRRRPPLPGHRSHVAIAAPSRQAAEAFHAAAIASGAATLREPGLRPDINPDYYGTMVKDLDGHTIEVVYWKRAA